MEKFKPMLACDWFQDKVKFPCIIQPKVDGVHSLNQNGICTGRSLKKHDNIFITEQFSKPEYHGFQGEKYDVNLGVTHPDLCRITSGNLRRIEGVPDIGWILFDYITENTYSFGYQKRMELLQDIFSKLHWDLKLWITIMPSKLIENMDQLLEEENNYLDLGYEGAMIRDPNAPYKFGRCGKTHMGVWRIKRFIDAEFLIEEIIEGEHNNNEAKTNLLGRTERSTLQENMQPNGMVGTLRGTLLADVLDPQTKEVILKAGIKIDVAPGNMSHAERKYIFENQHEFLLKIGKFKLFPKGVKDKPRFAQFQGLRNSNDM